MRPVAVGALWCLGRAGLACFAVAARRGERARLNGESAAGGCREAQPGCWTAVKTEGAWLPEQWLSVEVVKWDGLSVQARCLRAWES
jgi:hypothetical protein